jgi:hypothetical protein
VRNILKARRREHFPANARRRTSASASAIEWGVAVLHGGREIHWYSIAEARRAGANLISLANLAARPGELPQRSSNEDRAQNLHVDRAPLTSPSFRRRRRLFLGDRSDRVARRTASDRRK